MGLESGKNFSLYIDGYNTSSQCNKVAPKIGSRSLGEVTAAQDEGKKYLPVMDQHSIAVEGYYDAASGAVGPLMDALRSASANSILLVVIGSEAQGAKAVMGSILSDGETRDAAVGDVVKVSFSAQLQDTSRVGIVLDELTTWAADGDGDIHDNSASSSDGGIAVLQVISASANISTIDVSIRDSNDNFVGDDNELVAFDQQVAGQVANLQTITGTIERYSRVRLATTRSDGEAWTVAMIVGLARS